MARDVRIEVGCDGRVLTVSTDVATQPHDERVGLLLPAIVNVHSHAFQRGFAGETEYIVDPADSFWTWREQMYAAAAQLDPDRLYATALALYQLMKAQGYGWVCEFHYVHHQPDGTPYVQPAALALALVEAAKDAGLGMTLLPVLYQLGGFDGRALSPRQQRFGNTLAQYFALLDTLKQLESPHLRIGMAIHSLRAVAPDALSAALAEFEQNFDGLRRPIHIHIAEQMAEVDDCLAQRGARPVEWLLRNAAVDARWCLVHATHLTPQETWQLAASGAVVGLCPSTEANLGDGLFPLAAFRAAGGRIAIGSDSHASVDPLEELRWLEYGQRLISQRRNIYGDPHAPDVALNLWRDAALGGAQAAGLPPPLTPGAPAAWLALESNDVRQLSQLLFRHPHQLELKR